ncbi:ankyrin repeat domain-containing protein [Treponema sp.]|uniref:ankyrin repeat domain-containing protein n=1 Tax=Treponema sp. TaxID=166 RepID=UPI00388FFA95
MKQVTAIFIFLFSLFYITASPWSERAFYIVESESQKNIRRAIETDYSFVKYTRGADKENVLMAALKHNRDNEVISLLLKAGVSPDSKTKNGVTSFMYACQYETNIDVIEDMLKTSAFRDAAKKKRILTKDKNGLTSFDYARMNETHSEDILEILRQYADEPAKEQPEDNEKPQENTETGSEEISESIPEEAPVEVLTESGENLIAAPVLPAEPEVKTEAVVESEVTEEKEIVNKLIDFAEASSDSKIIRESIYLYDYADDKYTASIIPESLILAEESAKKFISDANKKDSSGKTKLMQAAKSGDIALIENLLYSGAEINAKDDDGWTALMYAARFQKNPDVTRLLLYKGADRTIKNKYGLTSLQLAAGYSQNSDVVSALLDSCKPDSEEAREAFFYGISNYNNTDVLQAFINKKVPLNIPYDGKTPLMIACQTNNNTKIIDWLLKNGASKYQVEVSTGKTAYDYAKENKKLPHNLTYWSLNPNS